MKSETLNIGGTELIIEVVEMGSRLRDIEIRRGNYDSPFGEVTCEIAKPDLQEGDEFELAGGRFVVTEIVARYEQMVSIKASGKTRVDFERALSNM